jgi:hypothetical protein
MLNLVAKSSKKKMTDFAFLFISIFDCIKTLLKVLCIISFKYDLSHTN